MLVSTLILMTCEALMAQATSHIEKRSSPAAYCSSSDSVYKLSNFDAPVSGNGNANGLSTWTLTIDDTQSGYKQTIKGFGAAVTDATVTVFNSLPAGQLSNLLKTLMTSAGANFGLVRHTIGSSDLSGDPAYTYDDNGGKVDTGLSGFSLGDRGTAMANLLARMRSLRSDLTILGSPWSAPGWMKLNGVLSGQTTNNNLNPSYRGALASFFVKYLQAYASLGASIDAITIQNEPLNSQAGYPTMYVYAGESSDIIKQNVVPALRAAGLDTQVWAYDHNLDVPSYPQTVLDANGGNVPVVAWHCYATNNNWTVMTAFHNTNPNTAQIMTECWTSPQTGWDQAASFTMGPLQNWGQGAMAWTLGSDKNYGPHLSSGGCSTCRGLVIVDSTAGTYDFAIDYYMMAQFSKFMPKGSTVLGGTGSYTYGDGTGLQHVATKNADGSTTVVMINKFANDLYVTLHTKSGKTYSGRVYKQSTVTWVLP